MMEDELIFERDDNGLLHQIAGDADISSRHRHAVHGIYFVLFTPKEEADLADRLAAEEAEAVTSREVDKKQCSIYKEAALRTAMNKLRVLGMNDDEINALFGAKA
jgi:hypothetical protein